MVQERHGGVGWMVGLDLRGLYQPMILQKTIYVCTIAGSSKLAPVNMVISLTLILASRLPTEKDHGTAANILIILCEHLNSFICWWLTKQDTFR